MSDMMGRVYRILKENGSEEEVQEVGDEMAVVCKDCILLLSLDLEEDRDGLRPIQRLKILAGTPTIVDETIGVLEDMDEEKGEG